MHFLCSPKRFVDLGYRHSSNYKTFVLIPNGEEKTNLPMLKELASGTLIRRVAQLRKVYKIKDKF